VAMHNVIAPMMCSAMGGFGMMEGERPWFEIRYAQSDGRPGLPEDVAALFLPGGPRERVVRFYNRGSKDERVSAVSDNTLVGSKNGPLAFASATLDGRAVGDPAKGITIVSGRVMELRMELA